MDEMWFYVEGKERVGPIESSKMKSMIEDGTLGENDYVWKKGFENWRKISEVPELIFSAESHKTTEIKLPDLTEAEPPQKLAAESPKIFDWGDLDRDKAIFSIKVGLDRSGDPAEYGPYSINTLVSLYKENRINEKTYVFSPKMPNWSFLGDLPIYSEFFSSMPAVIDESDRRTHVRKPFVARLLFHNTNIIFEGVCRDISIGGMQVLVNDFPGKQGDKISLNVHPDNSELSFSADAEIVRLLDGGQGVSFRFKDLNLEAKHTIEQFIKEN